MVVHKLNQFTEREEEIYQKSVHYPGKSWEEEEGTYVYTRERGGQDRKISVACTELKTTGRGGGRTMVEVRGPVKTTIRLEVGR